MPEKSNFLYKAYSQLLPDHAAKCDAVTAIFSPLNSPTFPVCVLNAWLLSTQRSGVTKDQMIFF